MTSAIRYQQVARDPNSRARRGILSTPHGEVETPAFMPVGTQATVKGLLPDSLRQVGTSMVLANTYHLALRPGAGVVRSLGGLHSFMAWDGPILTDSGGFQAFSMAERVKWSESGIRFKSHLDGSTLDLTPEAAVAIQESLGADVAMCLDECPALPASKEKIAEAVARTIRWARRCKDAQTREDQGLFGIVQGGAHEDLRAECVEALLALEFPGYAVGGVSVGEAREEVRKALDVSVHLLPEGKPRYLMGVGRPADLLDAVAAGVDLFDCVLPTRNGRNATCLTASGPVKMRNAIHKNDPRPIEVGCDCPACSRFSRAYIRHLFLVGEMLGPILASLHNLSYLHRLMREVREAISGGRFVPYRRSTLEALGAETVHYPFAPVPPG